MSQSFKHDPLWAKAKKVCRISQEDIAMAKQLGLKPRTLMKNNPSPNQQWKLRRVHWSSLVRGVCRRSRLTVHRRFKAHRRPSAFSAPLRVPFFSRRDR